MIDILSQSGQSLFSTGNLTTCDNWNTLYNFENKVMPKLHNLRKIGYA